MIVRVQTCVIVKTIINYHQLSWPLIERALSFVAHGKKNRRDQYGKLSAWRLACDWPNGTRDVCLHVKGNDFWAWHRELCPDSVWHSVICLDKGYKFAKKTFCCLAPLQMGDSHWLKSLINSVNHIIRSPPLENSKQYFNIVYYFSFHRLTSLTSFMLK